MTMAKYKILVIGHQLKNNIVAKCNDVVDESQLMGMASELEKAGFIQKVTDVSVEEIEVVSEESAKEVEVTDVLETKLSKKKK